MKSRIGGCRLKIIDREILRVIRLTLLRSVVNNIMKEKTTVDLMKAMSSMYEKLSTNKKMHLMKQLFNLKKIEGTSE